MQRLYMHMNFITKEINVTDEDIRNLMKLNSRLLLLLGMITPLLIDCKYSRPKAEHYKFYWFTDALNAVIYENKPIPPFPDKNLL